MKIIVYGGHLNDPEQVAKMENELGHLKGTCYVSEKQKKPNGVWKRKEEIDSDGVWFFKNRNGHRSFEVWKLVRHADSVILDNSIENNEEKPFLLNSDDDCEVMLDGLRRTGNSIAFFLSEKYHPIAYSNKLEELVELGMSVSEARNHIDTTPIDLEIYYEKGKGLFAVECDVVEKGGDIYSPYSKTKLERQ